MVRTYLLCSLFICLLVHSSDAQNVGIGVDTPQTKLHVSGTLLTDSLLIPTGARDGYLLKSDSIGNGYWAPVLDQKIGPSLLDAFQFNNTQPEYIDIEGNYAYVACDNADSLLVFDLSDPGLPVKVGAIRISFGSVAQGLVVDGNYAYADYGPGIFVYDISDPTNPLETDVLIQNGEDLDYHNGYLYMVGNFYNGLVTINVQNPDSIFVVDTIVTGGDPNGIAIDDGKAYVVDAGTLDLKIFDLFDPENPVLLGSKTFGSFPTFIDVSSGIAYVTDNGTDSLYLFDVSDSSNPILASVVGGFSVQNGIRINNSLLYMSDSGLDSLHVFDVSDPYQPKSLGAISVKLVPTRMDVRGEYIYQLNESPDRIEVLRITQNLVTTDLQGGTRLFDGHLQGLVTIRSNDLMGHLRLNRIGAGGVHLTATDPPGFMVTADDGNELLFANAVTGAVGIGTDEPGSVISSAKLEVEGGHIVLGNNFGVLSTSSDTSGTGAGFDTGSDDDLDLYAGGTKRMTITPSGNVGLGPSVAPKLLSLRAPDDTLSGPIIQFTGTGTDQFESGRIRFVEGSEPNHRGGYIHYDGNANRLHIGVHDENGSIMEDDLNAITMHRNTGQVGIGQENPIYDLDVFNNNSATISLQDTNTHLLLTSEATQATIRTVNEQVLRFYTNNTPRMTINHLGLVGIGETGPQFPLVVKDDLGENTGLGGLVKFHNGSDIMFFDANEIDATTSTLFLQNNVTHGLSLVQGGGNVGIGVAPAAEKLTVAGTIHSTAGGIKYPDGTTQSSSGWTLNGNAGTGGIGFIGTTDAQAFQLKTNSTNRMHIDASGKIGLNTTATRTMLTLRGPDSADNGPVMFMYGNGSDQVESGRIRFVESTSSNSWRGGYIHYDGGANKFHFGVHNTSDKILTNDVKAMTIERSSGEVGIGTTSPTALLEVNATTVKKTGGGSWTASSDIRLKQEIQGFTDGLESVLALNPVQFRYNQKSGYDTSEEHIGVIAQELEEIAPYMVSTFEKDGVDYLEVDNSAMTYMLINAVQELHQKIKDLQSENGQLKFQSQELDAVKSELELLKDQVSELVRVNNQ